MKKLEDQYSLLTEAEWEYAARAGMTKGDAFGKTVTSEQVNFNGEHQVGRDGKGKLCPGNRFNDIGLRIVIGARTSGT